MDALKTNIKFVLCVAFLIIISQAHGQCILPKSALNEFAPSIYRGADANNIAQWVKKHKGVFIKKGWVPPKDSCLFAAYHVKLVQYWFGPYPNTQQLEAGVSALSALRKQITNADIEGIVVLPVRLTPGEPMSYSKFPLLVDGYPLHILSESEAEKWKKDLDELARKAKELKQFDIKALEGFENAMGEIMLDKPIGEAIQRLGNKYGEGTGGLKGPFPASYSFSKWFAMMIDVVTDIIDCAFFDCQLKDKIEQILLLAYIIMPEVMDRIASSLARLQDRITPNSIDRGLNTVADFIEPVYGLYKDLEALKTLLSDPDFQSLLKDANLDKILETLGKKLLAQSKKQLVNIVGQKIGGYLPLDCISLDKKFDEKELSKCLDTFAKKKFKSEVIHQAKKYASKVPFLEKIDLDELTRLYEDPDFDIKKFAREQSKKLICPYATSKGYGSECEEIINGNYEAAAKSAAGKAIKSKTGVDINQLIKITKSVESGDYKEVLKNIKETMPKAKYLDLLGVYANSLDSLIAHPERGAKMAVETFINNAINIKQIEPLVKSGKYILDRIGKGEVINWENAIPLISEEINRRTGIDPLKVNAIFTYLRKENYKLAFEEILNALDNQKAIIYYNTTNDALLTKLRIATPLELKQLCEIFLNKLVNEEVIRKTIGIGTYLFDRTLHYQNVNLDKISRDALGSRGIDSGSADSILVNSYGYIFKDFANALGFKSEKAKESFQQGKMQEAIALEIAYQKTIIYDTQQPSYRQSLLRNKQEKLEMMKKIFEEQMKDPSYRIRLLYDKHLQK